MKPLKALAVILPFGIAGTAISVNRGLLFWLILSPVVLFIASIWLGWAYWLAPRTENIPIAPELNLLGSCALAGASIEPFLGLIHFLAGQPGDGAIGNWVYVLFIPLWAILSLLPGSMIAVATWMRDWRGEGESKWI